KDLRAVLPGNYSAIVVPAGWPGLIDAIKELRRDPAASSLPIVVVGACDARECYAAGADECVEELDEKTVERVRAKAARMSDLWAEAERDPLTGLYNRRFLERYLAEMERRRKETGAPFSVMMADLDHFKSVNDTYGHQAGDEVLKEFGRFLRESVRQNDVAARYGGEEFVVVFSGDSVLQIAERLCREWAGREVALPDGEKIRCTFSAGLAEAGRDGASADELVRAADQALYRAKSGGRNRVVCGTRENAGPAGKPGAIMFSGNCITVCSPWLPGAGVTTFVINLAEYLVKKGYRVGLIDADFGNPQLALKLGMSVVELWKYDWRSLGAGAGVKIRDSLYLWPLDPMGTTPPSGCAGEFSDVLKVAGEVSDRVIIDGGSDPERELAGHRILLVGGAGREILNAWEFYRPFTEGAAVYRGAPQDFGLPLLGSVNDKNTYQIISGVWKGECKNV
ncbi:MAG: diguanylate cyclase, partial [Peptococcaceae bacterium]|nr:diguanylate cyclase [Peptococcaceae bacterium]